MAWVVRWAGRAAVVLAVVAVGGIVVVISGVVPIKASSGHWAITAWALHFAMRRSISTHTALLDLPADDEPWRVVQGAGHYEDGCRPCHGSPGRPMPRIAAAMRPHPPDLTQLVRERDPEALFYVVQHGLKFTGMPAWPTQEREDEVRSMVAFLREMPGMDEARYRQLVFGDEGDRIPSEPMGDMEPGALEPLPAAAPCARCHGEDGSGRGSAAFPKLAGQRAPYLLGALQAYASDRRHSGIMEPIASAVDVPDLSELARHYEALGERSATAALADAGAVVDERSGRGEVIALEGDPGRGVPACASCHGPAEGPRNAAYPRLGGQFEDYLLVQLRLFAERRRGGSPYAAIMELVASRMTEEQRRDVAAYYAAGGPTREPVR